MEEEPNSRFSSLIATVFGTDQKGCVTYAVSAIVIIGVLTYAIAGTVRERREDEDRRREVARQVAESSRTPPRASASRPDAGPPSATRQRTNRSAEGSDSSLALSLAEADGINTYYGSPVLEPYESRLGVLARRYGHEKGYVSSCVLIARGELAAKGVNATCLGILGDVIEADEHGAGNIEGVFAVYVTLRTQ